MKEIKRANTISTDQLNSLLTSDSSFLLLDSLPHARYQKKHLPNAVNVCVFEVDFFDQLAEITQDKDQEIVVYGVSEKTYDAIMAAEKLLRGGYLRVSILTGGLAAWQAAGYLLEGDSVDEVEPQIGHLADGSYPIDVEASVIEWAGRNSNSTHWGILRLSSGEVRSDAGKITGNFTIDMHSIENVNLAGDELKPVLENHLKSDDFFFIKHFPETSFEMTARLTSFVQPVSSPNYEVTGRLKLCGISAEQNFPATIVSTEDGKIVAEAHFDIDRTRWGVIYGSTSFFEYLGMHLVFDLVSVQLRIMTK